MAQNIGLQSRLKKFLLVESTEHFVNFSDLRGTNIRRVEMIPDPSRFQFRREYLIIISDATANFRNRRFGRNYKIPLNYHVLSYLS